MLELKLKKESLFLKALQALPDLIDVAIVDCSSTGLKLQAVDIEVIMLVELFFPAEDFQHYDCDKDLSMGISIVDMLKPIRCADEDYTITIKVGDENFDTITLSFESPNGNSTTTCELRLVDASSKRLRVEDWQVLDSNYQASVQMPSAEFMCVFKYLSNPDGKDADISLTEEGLRFFAWGDIEDVSIKYMQPEKEKATATNVTYIGVPVSLTLILNLKYMYSIAKASTLFDEVKIYLSSMQPLMVKCKIGKIGYIRYILAPKVSSAEENEEVKDPIG